MSAKKKRRLLQMLGFITGLLFGYIRPFHMQNLLPILGVAVGVSYFFLTSKFSDKDASLDDIFWFPIVQMVLYFLIGGALTSTILLTSRMMQMQ